MKIQKRRPTLEAMQFDPEHLKDMMEFLGYQNGVAYVDATGRIEALGVGPGDVVSEGEWVLKNGSDMFILPDKQFHQLYEVAE